MDLPKYLWSITAISILNQKRVERNALTVLGHRECFIWPADKNERCEHCVPHRQRWSRNCCPFVIKVGNVGFSYFSQHVHVNGNRGYKELQVAIVMVVV